MSLIDPLVTVALCLAIVSVAPSHVERFAVLARRLGHRSGWPLVLLAAVWIAAFATLFAIYCFRGLPVLSDEFSQAFQGRILAAGRLSAVAEAYPAFFETAQTARVGQMWFSEFPIGGGLIAMLGDVTGLAIVINPALAALGGVLVWRFASLAFGQAEGRLAILLAALSPFLLFMSASRMNHIPVFAAVSGALAALAIWDSATSNVQRHRAAVIIGVAIGIIALFRPYDAVLIAVPVALFQLARCARMPSAWLSIISQCAAGILVVAVQLFVNASTTGDAWVFGYDVLNGAAHRPGFHTDPLGRAFTPVHGLYRVTLYLVRLNSALYESPVPALAFVGGALVILARPTRWDLLLVAIIGSNLVGYWAYWFDGNFVGPRFLFPAMPALLVLSARFVVSCWNRTALPLTLRLAGVTLLPMCLLVAWLPVGVTMRGTGVWLRALAHRNAPGAQTVDVDQVVRQAALSGEALVLVREPLHGRLAAQLRALGVAPYRAERLVADHDVCTLFESLAEPGPIDVEALIDRVGRIDARPVRGWEGARSISLASGHAPSRACEAALLADRAMGTPFDPFLARLSFDSAGRVGGRVVFARDLGKLNERLRDRFPGRIWYRFYPDSSRGGGRILPVAPPGL